MKCRCCNADLHDEELKLRDGTTGRLLDTCFVCLDAQGSSMTNEQEPIDNLTDIGIDL